MRANSQFTVALHILTWMALVTPRREVVTSDRRQRQHQPCLYSTDSCESGGINRERNSARTI